MEKFNAKLYDKYVDLKKRKLDEELISQRESDIRDYEFALEVIEELKNENERLRAELESLHERSTECENLLFEECRKTKHLSNEVRRLQNLLSEKNDSTESAVRRSPRTSSRIRSRSKSKGSPRKVLLDSLAKETKLQNEAAAIVPYNSNQMEPAIACNLSQTNNELFDHAAVCTAHTECCRLSTIHSGEETAKSQSRCLFQTLIELLVGLKFSIDSDTEGICISAIHQMSGYTFTLTWVRHEGGEGELRYHVSSLGTLERVALGWMKEDIIFSMTMWPVFFERISRVIGHC